MSRGKTPSQLGDISHLFLSGTRVQSEPEKDMVEAVVHLAVIDPSFCRAFFAAGTATALACGGTRVTILETGLSLPNVGYYFALEPREYLALSSGPVKSIAGAKGDSIRFCCAGIPGDLAISGARFPDAAGGHVIVNVFDSAAINAGGAVSVGVLDAWRAGSLYGMPGAEGLHAFVLFCDATPSGKARELTGSFRRYAPLGTVFLPAAAQAGTELAHGCGDSGIEYFEPPAVCPSGLCRRVPPEDRFFQGLASRVLQILGSRRRKGLADAVR